MLPIDIYITANSKDKPVRQAESIPYFSRFWDWSEPKYCPICGYESLSSSVCRYCKAEFPIKKEQRLKKV